MEGPEEIRFQPDEGSYIRYVNILSRIATRKHLLAESHIQTESPSDAYPPDFDFSSNLIRLYKTIYSLLEKMEGKRGTEEYLKYDLEVEKLIGNIVEMEDYVKEHMERDDWLRVYDPVDSWKNSLKLFSDRYMEP